MPFAAFRARTALPDETGVEVHLASLPALEIVGLLLGARGSVATSSLTMTTLWTDSDTSPPEGAVRMFVHGFIHETSITLPWPTLPNFEHLIDSLEIALPDWAHQVGMFGNPTIDYDPGEQELVDKLCRLRTVRAALVRSVVNAVILREGWWPSPNGEETNADGLASQGISRHRLVSATQLASEFADQREIHRIAGLPRLAVIVFGGNIAMPTLLHEAARPPTPHSGEAHLSGCATEWADVPSPQPENTMALATPRYHGVTQPLNLMTKCQSDCHPQSSV